ncbi:MAG: peptide chain release factor 2 [Brevinema sp.]
MKIGGVFDLDQKIKIQNSLKEQMVSPEVWEDHKKIAELRLEISKYDKITEPWLFLQKNIKNLVEFIEFSESENDTSSLNELEQEYTKIEKTVDDLEIQILLNGEMDQCNAFLDIHPGAGGTESQDWAEMLLRMYQRWALKKGFTVEVISLEYGDEAGIKDATLLIKGAYAFGYLSAENGIHRLVRLSPFNAQNKRQTSFCGISVSPEIDDTVTVIIEDKDLRIDTFRASGAGGQHVNKVSSAIRITHIPTGIVVTCQNDRSQFQNKENALSVLKSKLYELERQKKDAESAAKALDRKSVEWGNQIRSYTFQPSMIVKDHRTNIEKGNAQAVMDGDLDDFIIGWLKKFKTNN